MKELDFDELDRAVNSLMSGVPKSKPQAADASEKVLELDLPSSDPKPAVVSSPVAAPVTTTPSSAPTTPESAISPATPLKKPSESAPARPVAAPAARRGGRFMDVVHPSMDMKKTESASPISRSGVTIEPRPEAGSLAKATAKPDVAPVISETVPAEKDRKDELSSPISSKSDITPDLEPDTKKPVSETTNEPSHVASSDWPDPLDMMPSEPKKEEPVPAPEVEPETKQEPVVASDLVEPTSLTSPFLPDAKVEKRPLGAAQTLDSVDTTSGDQPEQKRETDPKTVNDPAAQLPADPTEVTAPLPEELQGDLMAVEADTTHEKIKQTHDEAVASVSTQPEAESAVSSPAPAESTGPTSIPQQYREEKTVTEVENGTIYDTDHYHQPIAQPSKGKPSWIWVVWVAAVLILGAAGGALLYFLKLV